MIRPFFSFYGSKWRIAPRYPAPLRGEIVEPFAGSAGYALRYPDRRVSLYEKDPVVFGVWAWLIGTTARDVLALPDLGPGETVDDLAGVHQEARWFIGFWLNKGASSPRKRAGSWMRSGKRPNSTWGKAVREMVASQLHAVQHWSLTLGSYDLAFNRDATWFVDPPYDGPAGRHYRHHGVDYHDLARFCRTRRGQVIACENEGANWLPFTPLVNAKSTRGVSKESVWTNADDSASRKS